MKLRLRAPSPAFVISLIALFVALGGTTAYASGLISGRQIVNHSISAKKLTAGAVNALQGRRGPAGPGAISLSKSEIPADSVRHLLASTHGIAVSYACDSNSDQIRIFLNPHHRPGHSASVIGYYAQDGVLKSVQEFGGLKVGGGLLNVDVITGTRVGPEGDGISSHINLSGLFIPAESSAPPSTDTCAVWGLITPGAQPSYGN
jgi:hypothetical protein